MLVPVPELWLPILLSAVLVFFGGFILNAVLPHHRSDYRKLEDEDGLMQALRSSGQGAGNFMFPHVTSHSELKDEAVKERMEAGPMGFVYMVPPTASVHGKQLIQYFLYAAIVSAGIAYAAGISIPRGADYLVVFRFVGTVAWLTYAGYIAVESIFYGFKWSASWKKMFDAFAYACLTAGVFGWLWP